MFALKNAGDLGLQFIGGEFTCSLHDPVFLMIFLYVLIGGPKKLGRIVLPAT